MSPRDLATPATESLFHQKDEPLCSAQLRSWRLSIWEDARGFQLFVGPWAICVSWSLAGRFGNGSRWHSGWHRWDEDE